MTTLAGDLPDWTVEAAPDIINISVFNQGFSANTVLFDSTTALRIWGCWISGVMASDGTFVATGLNDAPRIVLADNSILLALELNITNTKDKNQMFANLDFSGFTPPQVGGHFTANLVTDAGATGSFLHVNCGLFYSIP